MGGLGGDERKRNGVTRTSRSANACCCINSGKTANVCLVEWLLLWLSVEPPLSPPAALFHSVLLFFFIWDETGRSACIPLQGVVSLLSNLVTFLSSIEVPFGSEKSFINFATSAALHMQQA